MSNPSTSQSSRPESYGLDDGTTVPEPKQSFQVENEKNPCLHLSASDATRICYTSDIR